MVTCRLIIVVVFLFGSTLLLQAQDVRATARVDSNNIPIGGAVTLHLEVQHPNDISMTWPPMTTTLEGLEIVGRLDSSAQSSGQSLNEKRSYHVTGFDAGTFYISPLSFTYTIPGDTAKRTVQTSAIPIVVHGIAVDTTQDLKDVKPPLSISISFAEVLPYLLAIVGLGLVGWCIYYFMKKKKLGERLIPETPPRPAHEVALEALRALEAEHLWQRGKIKEYQSQLTDILRTYIEHRYHVTAMEMTTEEIMRSSVIAALDQEIKKKLREILVLADFVKFAKFQPTSQEHETGMADALSIVEATWRPAVQHPQQTIVNPANV